MNPTEDQQSSIPLAEEQLTIDKRVVETGRVRIRSVVDEKLVRVNEELERDDVIIERVAVGREVTEPPQNREENGVLIVPILEEVVVIEKRLMLKEELHIRRNRKRERIDEAVRVKSMHAEVERVPTSNSPGRDAGAEHGPEGQPAARSTLHRQEPLLKRNARDLD